MAEPSGVPLSPMHKRMLRMMRAGKGRHDMAKNLGISPETVRTRVREIKRRVGVDRGADVRELLRVARDRGFFDETTKPPEKRIPGRRRHAR